VLFFQFGVEPSLSDFPYANAHSFIPSGFKLLFHQPKKLDRFLKEKNNFVVVLLKQLFGCFYEQQLVFFISLQHVSKYDTKKI